MESIRREKEDDNHGPETLLWDREGELGSMGFQPMARPLTIVGQMNLARSKTAEIFSEGVSKAFGVGPTRHGLEAHATFTVQ